jgi:hypothetical protein
LSWDGSRWSELRTQFHGLLPGGLGVCDLRRGVQPPAVELVQQPPGVGPDVTVINQPVIGLEHLGGVGHGRIEGVGQGKLGIGSSEVRLEQGIHHVQESRVPLSRDQIGVSTSILFATAALPRRTS